ncbi:MAG: hypothetical protein AB7V32_03845 [Candidatus Berkiella sp.]
MLAGITPNVAVSNIIDILENYIKLHAENEGWKAKALEEKTKLSLKFPSAQEHSLDEIKEYVLELAKNFNVSLKAVVGLSGNSTLRNQLEAQANTWPSHATYLQEKINAMQHQHQENTTAMQRQHQEEITTIQRQHQENTTAMQRQHQEEIQERNKAHEQALGEMGKKYEIAKKLIGELGARLADSKDASTKEREELEQKLSAMTLENQAANDSEIELADLKAQLEAAQKTMQGLQTLNQELILQINGQRQAGKPIVNAANLAGQQKGQKAQTTTSKPNPRSNNRSKK